MDKLSTLRKSSFSELTEADNWVKITNKNTESGNLKFSLPNKWKCLCFIIQSEAGAEIPIPLFDAPLTNSITTTYGIMSVNLFFNNNIFIGQGTATTDFTKIEINDTSINIQRGVWIKPFTIWALV